MLNQDGNTCFVNSAILGSLKNRTRSFANHCNSRTGGRPCDRFYLALFSDPQKQPLMPTVETQQIDRLPLSLPVVQTAALVAAMVPLLCTPAANLILCLLWRWPSMAEHSKSFKPNTVQLRAGVKASTGLFPPEGSITTVCLNRIGFKPDNSHMLFVRRRFRWQISPLRGQ